MNILFLTEKEVNPLMGGIERMTAALAGALERGYGDQCYYLHKPYDGLETLISEKNINIIVAQGAAKPVHDVMPRVRKAVDELGAKAKIVFVFHNLPGQELINRPWYMRPFRPILKRLLRNKYAIPYQCADAVMLLCSGYINRYQDIAKCGKEKFIAQGNALSFSSVQIKAKNKTVLVVTRLEERHKRVSAIIKIWREIEKDSSLTDWKLKIVGYGPHAEKYKKFASDLSRIEFVGYADPTSYYEDSSIFLMTSAFEGFPMTILEAQQNGCVPIAFDSFEALHDIITDERDGFIIADNDYKTYIHRLKLLMKDEDLLRGMSEEARRNCQVHSQEQVASSYRMCFNNILSQ